MTSWSSTKGWQKPGVPVVGGDTSAAEQLVLSVTALGTSERVPGRGGARPGDVLVVTGPLGAAGAAFREQRYVRPPVRLDEGRELASTAPAMLDLSDGLAVDAGHIAARSGCRLVIELERVPLADGGDRSTTSASARTTSCWPPCPGRAASRRSAAARRARASTSCSQASPRSYPASSTSGRASRISEVRSEPASELLFEVRARPGADDCLLRARRPRRGSLSGSRARRSSAARAGCSSMFIFTKPIRSLCSASSSSSTFSTPLHGPHQGAQKSTKTGRSAPRTSAAKLSSVTSTIRSA